MTFRVLGIESSCDETAAAIVADGSLLLSSVVASQIERHREFGGVVPELASRLHVEAILPVVSDALANAQMSLDDIDAIAVTQGPGLIGALLVGVMAAKGLALVTGKPLLPVHHLSAHLAATRLSQPTLKPPFLALLTSGGHTHLINVTDWGKHKIVARTRDDSAGETLDKVARFLGLGYPGGPAIELAAQGGNPNAFILPSPRFLDSLDFSFSGLKTAARTQYGKYEQQAKREGKSLAEVFSISDFAATLQNKVISILVDHTRLALEETGQTTLVVAGGVAANKSLRQGLDLLAEQKQCQIFYPPMELCTDNAAMVAAAGYDIWQSRGDKTYNDYSFDARSTWSLDLLESEI